MKSRIAYIDDNRLNLECIKTILDGEFEVSIFSKPEKFLSEYNGSFDAILIDIHMPTLDGFMVYEKIIEMPQYNGCPVLFISSDISDYARIKSFTIGAVDFINRSVCPDELKARVKSKIQFFSKHRSIIEFTNLRVNLTLLKAYLNSKDLGLTFIEFKLLCLALRTFPEMITREQLVQEVWRSEHVLGATIYTHISNLNTKLDEWDYELNAVRMNGFQLQKKEKRI